MGEEDNRHYTAVKPSLGLIGWEVLLIGGVGGYQFCQYTDRHWLYGVLIAFAIAGVFFALIAQPIVRKLLFVAVSLAAGTFVALLLMMWADKFISTMVGLVAVIAIYYWHSVAYEVFAFGQKSQQRTKERQRYLDVRDEFERL